jgi:hypothetical protein
MDLVREVYYDNDKQHPKLFIGKDEEGRMLAAVTKWDDEAFGDKDFEQILFTMMQAGINPDYYYLFSKEVMYYG